MRRISARAFAPRVTAPVKLLYRANEAAEVTILLHLTADDSTSRSIDPNVPYLLRT